MPFDVSSTEFFPILLVGQIEIFSGSSAEILSKNSNGLLINFVSRQFNTRTPYTQLWISQAGYEYLGSSGIFSQNILKNLNFYFLYQRFWSAGRYANSNSDKWNIVAGVRWLIDSNITFYFENKYTVLNNALYGGLNAEKSTVLFDNTFSVVNFEHLNRKSSQNDFSVSFLYYIKPDSSVFLSSSLLFSYSKQDFELEPYLEAAYELQGNSRYKSSSLVLNTKLNIEKSNASKFLMGFELSKTDQPLWAFIDRGKMYDANVFGIYQYKISEKLGLNVGSRVSKDFDYTVGSRFQFEFDTAANLYLDLSYTNRKDNILFKKSFISILGLSLSRDKFRISSELFGRRLFGYGSFELTRDSSGNPINLIKTAERDIYALGVNTMFSVQLFRNFNFTSKLNLNYFVANKETLSWLPLAIFTNSISYRFTRGESYLDIGVEFELFSPFKGLYFHPLYSFPVEYQRKREWQNNGINLFAFAKLGNAFVNVSFRNLLSTNFYLLPIYPEYDRNVRITVFWSFND
jgi:hypothetical protein